MKLNTFYFDQKNQGEQSGILVFLLQNYPLKVNYSRWGIFSFDIVDGYGLCLFCGQIWHF